MQPGKQAARGSSCRRGLCRADSIHSVLSHPSHPGLQESPCTHLRVCSAPDDEQTKALPLVLYPGLYTALAVNLPMQWEFPVASQLWKAHHFVQRNLHNQSPASKIKDKRNAVHWRCIVPSETITRADFYLSCYGKIQLEFHCLP